MNSALAKPSESNQPSPAVLRALEPGTASYLAKVGLLAAVYVLFARFGLAIHAVNSFATLVWPCTGIALAAILVFGYRLWPGIAIGAVLANLWTGAPLPVALGIGAGNTLEALLGAYALRRIPGFRSCLDRLQDVIGLVVLAGAASTAVSATIGVVSLLLGGIVTPDRFAVTWRAWWLGDAIGALIVAPLLLTFQPARDEIPRRPRLLELSVLVVLLALASYVIFERSRDGMASLLSPLLVWAAIRFDQRGAARAMFLVSVVAVWATARGHGPFMRTTVEEGLFVLQAFMALTAATFLVLGAAETELRRAKEEAEAANRAKDQFLAALSHELRTPLTPVLALASALESNEELPAEARRQLEIVRRNAELEARLIDDLLDLTRIAKGKLRLEPESVELSEVLDDVVEICREEAAARELVFERNGSGKGKFVDADPARIRQVFWNIVGNAIKFTPRGGRVRLRVLDPATGRIAVEVSDSGVGIEPSEMARIFQPFQQTGRAGGLGLGLAISTALVEAHGGTLTASSEGRGRGATFRGELPVLSKAAAAPLAARAPSAAAKPRAGRRVLLVEDHADTLNAARDLLAELGCEVVTAGSAEEALAAADAQRFDCVVSDLGLPDGNGLDVMRRLRERHGLSGIALTGYGMEEDVRRSREAGFAEHLVKPITFQRLEAAIERFFASSSGRSG